MGDEPGVVLLDVENVIGVNPGADLVESKVRQIRDLADPVAVFWAAFPQTLLSEQSRKALKAQGVKIQWAKARKNGADEALLKLAREAAAKGHRRFVVASADADLAAVADLGMLEIIAGQRQPVSNRLQARAAHVHRLPGPPTPRATLKTSMKLRAPGPDATAITDSGCRPDRLTGSETKRAGESVPIRWRPSTGQVAAAGLGLWAAGVCFGSGMAVGSILTRRLLSGMLGRRR